MFGNIGFTPLISRCQSKTKIDNTEDTIEKFKIYFVVYRFKSGTKKRYEKSKYSTKPNEFNYHTINFLTQNPTVFLKAQEKAGYFMTNVNHQ